MRNNKSQDNSDENGVTQSRWRPDSLWSCLVCSASALSLIIASGGTYCFGLLLPSLMAHFEESRQATAWVGALCMACGFLLSPVSSYIIDRFGFRATSMLGSLSCVIGFCLASFSSKLWMMYLTYGLLGGFGYRTIYNSSVLVVLQYFIKWRSLAVGIITSSTAVGIFAMTQITQFLLSTFGWQGAIRGFAALYFLCGLASVVYIPISSSEENKARDAATKQREDIRGDGVSVLRNKTFWVISASVNLIYFVYFVPAVHIVKHCEQELHIPGSKTAMLFTYIAIASFFSRHFFCKLGDFKYFKRCRLLQVSVTITGVSFLCLPLSRTFGGVVAIFVVYGLMDGGLNGQFSLVVFECVGKRKVNQAWGYLMFSFAFSIGTGVPLAGLIADKLGSYAVAFYTSGAICIAGASLMFLIPLVKQPLPESDEEQSGDGNELLVVERLTVL